MTNSIQSCVPSTATFPADGISATTITATVVDENQTAQTGITVSWTASAGNLSAAQSTSDDNGKATVDLTADTAGEIIVTATTTDDSVGKNVTVTAEAVSDVVIESCTSDYSFLPDDGSMTAIITAKVSPVQAGVTVHWKTTSGTLESPDSTTDTDGVATVTLTPKAGQLGMARVTATTDTDTTGQTAGVFITKTLEAPNVLNATDEDNHTLDHYDLHFGVAVIIPHYQGAEQGNTVNFTWGSHKLSFEVINPAIDLPKVINMNQDMDPSALKDGIYDVYYEAIDAAGNPSLSSNVEITVKDGGQTAPTLPAPTIPAAENDGYININDTIKGVTASVPCAGLSEGDFVTLYWNASSTGGLTIPGASHTYSHTVTAEDITAGSYEESILAETFFPNNGMGYTGAVDVYYSVQPASGSGEVLLSFTVNFMVDTVAP